ncbi:glycosyl hydrolase [Pedobacter yulinensis]|uniref:Glycosyl hydrolase n=1 Tax=Pedobacter yulinensis TaxID=2126353 RepID=A0A2T3HKB7_9SPHI|nr:glycoside hydrolase family 88 protein [Pedobacter yulinensis]PST82892.1 glycosyl hydrolase [Pedobacter yulinensis]
MNKTNYILITLLLAAVSLAARAQSVHFRDLPAGADPRQVGKLLSRHFLETPHTNFGMPGPPGTITYSEVCAWYGALKFAGLTGDKTLRNGLEARFRPLLYEKKNMQPKPDHVDPNVFGSLPLELYMQNGYQLYLEMGKWFADQQWTLPVRANASQRRLHEQGLSWQARLWIDDMYMVNNLQCQAFRATKDPRYTNRAAAQMVLYLDSIQRPNGLFYHAPDVPYFWGRGNGWMAAGMTELLTSLPQKNPHRARILAAYQTMMESLRRYQTPGGMWLQLVDDPASWAETSGTGMFAFALITGVKKGWLDEKIYGPVARKAWIALCNYIEPNGDVREVCQGTNKQNSRQYYLDRKRLTGDMHGQAPVLWCAFALLDNSR